MSESVQVKVYLPVDIYMKLRILAFARHLTMSKLVENLVDNLWKEDDTVSSDPKINTLIRKLIKKNPKAWMEGEIRDL